MRNFSFTTLLSIGVALASLSSCSRANYAFNPATPAYLNSARVHTTVADAAPEAVVTASAEAATPAPLASAARTAATTLARPKALATQQTASHSINHGPASHKAVAPAITRTTFTRAERKELKQTLRQVVREQKKAASPNSTSAEGKSQIVAALLCFFLGGLGIHDFYLGYIGKGILQIFLSIILVGFILVLIDLVRILTGSLKPKDGDYTTKL